MNLEIVTEGEKIHVKITFRNGWAGEASWAFINTCSDKFYAGLAAESLSRQLTERLRYIRRSAYENGYRAGRGKKPKETFFNGTL